MQPSIRVMVRVKDCSLDFSHLSCIFFLPLGRKYDKYLLEHLTLSSPLLADANWLVAATTVALCFLTLLLMKYMYETTEPKTPMNNNMTTPRIISTTSTVVIASGVVDTGTVSLVQRSSIMERYIIIRVIKMSSESQYIDSLCRDDADA